MNDICVDTKFPIHKGPVYPCHFCAMTFINLEFLYKHQIKCINYKLHILFKDKLKLQGPNKHLKEISDDHRIQNQRKFTNILFCDICFKEFNYISQLTQHVRSHTGEKPFVCKFCNKPFSHSSSLKRHTRMHTGEKPYKCNQCNQRFADPSVFKRHIRTHTGEKLFECSFCYKSFSRREHLNSHFKTHAI